MRENKYQNMIKLDPRGFAKMDNLNQKFDPEMSNRAVYPMMDINRSSSINKSSLIEVEKSLVENCKEEIENLKSKMNTRLNKLIFCEKSKYKKEVQLSIFESLKSNLVKQSKDSIFQFKNNSQNEYDALAKQLALDFEREIDNTERSFKWKIQQEKDIIKEEFQYVVNSEKMKVNEEINRLEKDGDHNPTQLTEYKLILEKNLQTKHDALIEKFKNDLNELQQSVISGSSAISQNIQSDFKAKLKSKIAELTSCQEYKFKQWMEEKDSIEEKHSYTLSKKTKEMQSDLSLSLRNLKEDHQNSINTSKELIFLRIQGEKENFINSLKIQIIDCRRNYRHQLEKIEQDKQKELNSIIKKYEDEYESDLQEAKTSHIKSMKEMEEKQEIMKKIAVKERENDALKRKLDILNDKLDIYTNFVTYAKIPSLSSSSMSLGVGILNKEHKRVEDLLSSMNLRESQGKQIDDGELAELEKTLIEKNSKLADLKFKISKLEK